MNINELKQLALHAAKNTAPANYSVSSVNAAVADGFKELAGSVNQFMKNRYDIYEVIVEVIDEVVPKRVANALDAIAEVKVVPQGERAIFKKATGRQRAKSFITQVGLSGVYETFRLDSTTFEVPIHAIGGAAILDFERVLDGSESLAEAMDVLAEGMEDAIFLEVQAALRGALNAKGRPDANKVSGSWDADAMAKLCATVRAYGNGAVIFAPPEFVAAMGADAIVPVGIYSNGTGQNTTIAAATGGVYSPDDIESIHRTGYINIFRGTPVVQMPQSFVDENNTATWLDPQIAYVLPGGNGKVVKVALEGNTQIHDFQNRDNSMEIHVYRKAGAAILTQYNWGIYQNTSIPQTFQG